MCDGGWFWLVADRLAYAMAGAFVGVLVEWRTGVFDRVLAWLEHRPWTRLGRG